MQSSTLIQLQLSSLSNRNELVACLIDAAASNLRHVAICRYFSSSSRRCFISFRCSLSFVVVRRSSGGFISCSQKETIKDEESATNKMRGQQAIRAHNLVSGRVTKTYSGGVDACMRHVRWCLSQAFAMRYTHSGGAASPWIKAWPLKRLTCACSCSCCFIHFQVTHSLSWLIMQQWWLRDNFREIPCQPSFLSCLISRQVGRV